VHYQEPFRQGYGSWEPKAADFLTDLRGCSPAELPAGAFTTETSVTLPEIVPDANGTRLA
jgi:hypothetical protein